MYAKQIQLKKFPWGGKVLLTRFPAQGSVSIVGSIAGGSNYFGSEEVAQTHAAMLLEGTAQHSKKELQQQLDDIGASLTFSATTNRLCFAGRVRVAHLEKLLALIGEALREPIFPTKELAIYKKREEASLTLELQDTRTQANVALARMLFSKSHPNCKESTVEARAILKTINQAALLQWHKKITGGKSLVVSLAGDIAPARVATLVDRYFKTLPHTQVKLPSYTKAAHTKKSKKNISIKNKASIDYFVGLTTGITSDHADYPALLLGMQVLGSPSGFTGRLMKTVREEEGLTYGVYAYLSGFQCTTDGYLSAWGTFAPQLFVQGKAAIMREIKKIVKDGVTEEETRRHRIMFEARSRVRLSTSIAFAHAAHDTVVERRPLSYLDTFPKRILKLSEKEVNQVLKKYLVSANMAQSAAGPV